RQANRQALLQGGAVERADRDGWPRLAIPGMPGNRPGVKRCGSSGLGALELAANQGFGGNGEEPECGADQDHAADEPEGNSGAHGGKAFPSPLRELLPGHSLLPNRLLLSWTRGVPGGFQKRGRGAEGRRGGNCRASVIFCPSSAP